MGKLVEPISEALKKRWVKALRSKKYTQGKYELRSSGHWDVETRLFIPGQNAFCCLGVLADVIDPEGWTDGSAGYDESYGWCPTRKAGPGSTWTKYQGSSEEHPVFLPLTKQRQRALADKNDKGVSFDKIADYIEGWK